MTKKFFTVAVCLCMAVGAFAQYSGGNGEEGKPYLISTKADMEALATAVNGGTSYSGKYFLLTEDLTGITTIIGNTSRPFRGNFDGGGHVLTVNISTDKQYVGVFGYADAATIRNLGVAGSVKHSSSTHPQVGGICGYMKGGSVTDCHNEATISASSTNKVSDVGGICGYIESSCSISNCYNTGSISSSSISPATGGICGYMYSSCSINNCYNTGDISATTSTSFSGGICGFSDAPISNCYNTGNISATTTSSFSPYSGGICGYSTSSISNCFAANATVTAMRGDYASSYVGRIVGHTAGGTLTNNYAWADMTRNGATTSSGTANGNDGAGVTADKFKDPNWLKGTLGWTNMDDNWYLPEGASFPALRIEPALRLVLPSSVTYGDAVTFTINSRNAATPVFETSGTEAVEIEGNKVILKKVGTVTITATQAETDMYKQGKASATLTIAKAKLTVTADGANSIYGNDLPAGYTFEYSGFVNNENETMSGVITTAPTLTCLASKGSDAGDYDITPSDAEADNYTFEYVKGTLMIEKRELTVTPDDKERIYGEADPVFTLSYTGFADGEDVDDIDTLPEAVSDATADSPVGDSYIITCSGGADTNYTFDCTNAGTLEITKAPLKITAKNYSRVYGAVNPAFGFEFVGFKNGEDALALSKLEAVCDAVAASPVDTYEIDVEAEADNYEITPVSGVLTIDKAPLTITARSYSRVYGEANPVFEFEFDGFKNTDGESVLDNLKAICAATEASDVGEYDIVVSVDPATNYGIILVDGKLTINKAPLEITARSYSRVYGDANPEFGFDFDGFMAWENETILTGLTAACLATEASNVGDYDIVVSVDPATNYDITPVNGTLTVTKAVLLVSSHAASRKYGESNPTFSFSYSGFVNGENEASLIMPPRVSCEATETTSVGYYPIVVSGGLATNYNFNYSFGVLAIDKAPVTITAQPATSVYGDALPPFACQYTGFANDENESVLTTPPSLSCDATALSDAGAYAITPSDAAAQNYTFTYQNGILTITKAPLTITADDAVRRKGEDNPAFTLSYSGFKNDETESVLDVLPTIACAAEKTSPMGFYDIVLSGGSDNNYDYDLVDGRLEVTLPNGIEDVSASKISIYPNPVRHDLYIQSESLIEKVEIYNQAGILVLVDKVYGGKMDVSRLAAGVYFVRVYVDGGVETKKVIVRE